MMLGWLALLVLVTIQGSEGKCDVESPTTALLCHVEAQLHSSFNPCLCSHVILHKPELFKEAENLKKTNPNVKVLSLSEEIKVEEVPKGIDGTYLRLEKHPAKDSLVDQIKGLATSFDNAVSSKRANAKYDGSEDTKNEMEIILEVPSQPKLIAKHYEFKSLAKYVSYFAVPSHNLTDSSEAGLAYHPSRLMGIDDILNADSLVDLMSSVGADRSQLIITLPAYGLHFELKNETENMPRSIVKGLPKRVSQDKLCKMIGEGGWTLERDEDLTAPYAYKSADWVSFDDSTSASIKAKYVLLRNLGGVAVASTEYDDWTHSCPGSPLVDTLHHTLTNLARKPRAAQLLSLQDQIHNSLLSSYSGDIQLSPYRIVRVVDRAGDVHVVRKEAKTEFECSRQGYFTHPSGCNRFYRCVKFNQYSADFTVFEYDCPAGLAFDERYEVCVWPGSLPDASACKGSSEIAPVPRSRFACSTEGYYADPENCRWFFACLDHQRDGHTPPTAYEFRCPFGLVFDNEKLACDWPWKVAGCGSGGAGYATVGHGVLYPGDILEGRLRPAYAQVSDADVSGGRIPNVGGGLVLGTSLLSGIAGGNGGNYFGSTRYGANGYGGSAGLGSFYSGSGSADGSYADNSGAYVHDPTGDTGGEYVHQEGPQVPYVHQKAPLVPYVHQSDNGAYVHQGDSGAYVHQGDSGAYVHQGGNGAYSQSGSFQNGAYRGSSGNSGATSYVSGVQSGYAAGNGGAYVHDTRGDFGGDYVHLEGSSGGSGSGSKVFGVGTGSYSGNQLGTGYVAGAGQTAYVAGNSGAYVHDTRGDAGGDYVHVEGASGGAGSGSAYISGANRGSAYVSGIASGGSYAGGNNLGTSYVSGIKSSGTYLAGGVGNSGAYVHDTRGDNGGEYYHVEGPSGGSGSGTAYVSGVNLGNAYVSGAGGSSSGSGYVAGSNLGNAYVSGIKSNGAYAGGNYGTSYVSGIKSSGAYFAGGVDNSGAYVHDTRGDNGGEYYHVEGPSGGSGAYFSSGSGGSGYVSGIKSSGAAYVTGVNSGAYNHDFRGDYGGQYFGGNAGAYNNYQTYYGGKYQVGQGAYNAKTNLYNGAGQYGSGAYLHNNGAQYSYSAYPVSTYGINVNSAKLYQQTSPVIHSYRPTQLGVQTTGYVQQAVQVQPITVTTAPKVPLKPVQYIQPAVQPVVSVSTPAPQVVGYHYEKIPAVTARPITVTARPVIPYSPVQYVKPVQPVQRIQPIIYSTPAPPVVNYSYKQPVISTIHAAPSPTYTPITVSSTPAVPLNPVQYVNSQSIGYSYPKPAIRFETPAPKPVVSYQQNVVVSTPAPPTYIKTQQIQPVVSYSYSQPIQKEVTYQRPIQPVVYSTPAPPVVSYTARPITVSSTPVVPYSPVQYQPCSSCAVAQTARPITVTSAPAVQNIGYDYPKPQIRFETPVQRPAPPAVSYSYEKPICTSCAVAQTARPITVTQTPVVPLSPVQYTPVQSIGYSYPKPSIRFETPKPVVHQYVSTPAPPVVSYSTTVRPVTVTSSPVIPYNPVQYVKPVQPIQQISVSTPAPPGISYTYQKPVYKTQPIQQVSFSSPAPPAQYEFSYKQPIVESVGYSYPKPAVRFETPVRVSTPAPPVSYQPIPTHPPSVITYQQVKTQTERPFVTVSSTPAVPYNPVQYVKPVQPIVDYNYVQQVGVKQQVDYGYEYSKPAVKFQTPRPVLSYQQPIKTVQPIAVSTPSPVINYSYQPVKTQTIRPVTVTSAPAVSYNPVQYVSPVQSYNYVKEDYERVKPATFSTTVRPYVSVSSTPAVPYNPVQYVSTYVKPQPFAVRTEAPPVINYSYKPQPTLSPITVTTSVPLNPVQYVKPAKPIFSYSYVRPEPIEQSVPVTTARPVVTQQVHIKPQVPSFVYNYESPSVQKEEYHYEQKVIPAVTTTQRPFVEYQAVRKQPVAVFTSTEQPQTYFQEYFEAKKTDYAAKSEYNSQVNAGYTYRQPEIRFEEKRPAVKVVDSGYYEQGQSFSSSFAPIIVPDVTTALPIRKQPRPVQTYVNTVEEESYYSSSPAPVDFLDENLNLHLDISKVGVKYASTTPEQIVQVTTVAPARNRVRINGDDAGYYVRKQKVRVKPVVTTENYPAYYTTTVKPVYSSTYDLSSPTLYSTTVRPVTYTTTYRPASYTTTVRPSSTTLRDDEIEVEDEESDDQLIQKVSGGFGEIVSVGDQGVIRQGSVSSTTVSSLKDGEAIVGVVKKERNQYTGRKKTKVVVVSRLSDFNPILVGKLGAECSCKSDTKTLDLNTRSRVRTRPTAVPSRDYLPTSTSTLAPELTNFDYDDASPPSPVVEIKPTRRSQRIFSTSSPIELSTVEYESSTRPARKIASGSGRDRLDPDVDCQRPGLFRHPRLCNKFYSCNWDEWKKRYTVSVFNCPIHLAFDSKLGACNWPSKGPACAENNLLV